MSNRWYSTFESIEFVCVYCMASTGDMTIYNFVSNVTGLSFQVQQMCYNTANLFAGISAGNGSNPSTPSGSSTKSGAQQLVASVAVAAVLALLY